MMGASQDAMKSPPAKRARADAARRVDEVFGTGIMIRWIKV